MSIVIVKVRLVTYNALPAVRTPNQLSKASESFTHKRARTIAGPLSSAALRTIGCTPAGKVFHFAKRQEGSQLSLQREQTSDNVKLFS